MVIYYNKNEGLELQADQLDNVLKCLEDVNGLIQTSDSLENASELTSLLMNLKENFNYLRETIANLKKLREMMNSIRISYIGKDITKTKKFQTNVDQFNELATSVNNHILEDNVKINNFYAEYVKNSDFIYNPANSKKAQEESAEKIKKLSNILGNSEDFEDELKDNKTLLISARKGVVELPYTVSELNRVKNKKGYDSLQETISKEYVVPITRYRNASIARFREGFNLMRKREGKGLIASMDLALELTFKSLLNPAIITACKSINELDIYLDCLKSNELEKFDLFEIKYEVAPHKSTVFDES